MRVVHRNAGSFENGGNEVRLGEGAHESGLAIDDGVRDTAHTELVREMRELIRFDADRANLWRGQRHPVSQAHGPGTVWSSRRGKDHDLGRLGQLGQLRQGLVTQARICPRDPLDRIDQRRELSPGRKALETDAAGLGVRGDSDRRDVIDVIVGRAVGVTADIDHIDGELFRGAVAQQFRHLTGVLAGGTADASRQDQARRARPRVEREMDRTGERGLEPILELLSNLLGDDRHIEGNTRREGRRKLPKQQYTRWCMKVYDADVSRTNIEIDDRLIAEVIRRYRLASKREAVELALRRLAGAPLSRAQTLALEGSGWEGDLAEMRRSRVRSR